MLITNIGRLITMCENENGKLGVIENAALLTDGENISWIGRQADLPVDAIRGGATSIDAEGSVVFPGLVDSHTHLIHAGTRELEFVDRARGKSYLDIARSGGGILKTVAATRAATEEELLKSAAGRASEALQSGTTTMEVKSGYGLSAEDELKMLRVARKLNEKIPTNIVSTFLGAHVVPEEFKNKREDYIKLLCEEIIPTVAQEKLATACDVFVEEEAFTTDEARKIAAAAKKNNLAIRLHIDQFSDMKGGELAAELGAISADHLDYLSSGGAKAMAKAGVVAGILPAASFFTGKGKYPSISTLTEAGVKIALATDYNPGTAPTLDLFLCATIAVTQMGLDPDLALLGITKHAADSLQLPTRGRLGVGCVADILILDCKSEYYPLYRFASNNVRGLVSAGELLWDANS